MYQIKLNYEGTGQQDGVQVNNVLFTQKQLVTIYGEGFGRFLFLECIRGATSSN